MNYKKYFSELNLNPFIMIKSSQIKKCSYCDKASELFSEQKQDVIIIYLSNDQISKLASAITEITGKQTPTSVPMIFHQNRNYLGGYTELVEYYSKNDHIE